MKIVEVEMVAGKTNSFCDCITLVIWWVFGGLIGAVLWFLLGCLCCCMPGIGAACRKIGMLSFNPLSKNIQHAPCCDDFCLCKNACNIIWLICCGWELFLYHALWTILCLPFMICCVNLSKMHWKMAVLALWPVGARLYDGEEGLLDRPYYAV